MKSIATQWASVLGSATYEELPIVSNPIGRVTAEDGRSFILKQLPEWPPGVGHIEEYRALQHLLASGLPVAVPIITDEGAICGLHEGVRYVLLPELPVDESSAPDAVRSPGTCRAVGATIARIHRALASCPWPIHSFTHKMNDSIDSPDLPAEIRERLTPAFADSLREYFEDLPTQRIHGDYNVGNLLLCKGEVSGLIDFDHLPIGPRIYDVVYYVVSRLRDLLEHGRSEQLVPELVEYIAGYRAEASLTPREIDAIAPAMFSAEAGIAEWFSTERAYDPEKQRRSIQAALWILDHFEELRVS